MSIGWRLTCWEQGRRDAREGRREKSETMGGMRWAFYRDGWDHERARMKALGKLPQLALPLQDCRAPIAESP